MANSVHPVGQTDRQAGRQALAPCRLMMPARRAQNSYMCPYVHTRVCMYVVCVETANNATCSGCISCLPPVACRQQSRAARQRYYHHRSVALFGFWQMANGSDSVTKCEIDCWRRQGAGGVTVKRRKKLAIAIDAVEKGCERRAS